ncbi:type III secretion system protein, partial [Salmonella enterica subsp. enterica serovar Bredeney]|nr:type III secretion system protein [Salmonella enterica]EDV3087626.1 type III secretion system protein [Salmonella enterica subsp. enterica serovar Bredeney]
MISGRYGLRLTDKDESKLKIMCSSLPGSEVVAVTDNVRYVSLLISDRQNNVACVLLDIDEFLIEKKMYLPEIPWLQVPLNYIVQWLKNIGLQFVINETTWNTQQVTIPKNIPKKMLRLPSKPVSLLCAEWPLWNKPHPFIVHDELTFELRFVLGYSVLSLNDLINIVPGDIVIIECANARIMTGQYVLYEFAYDEEKGGVVGNMVNTNTGVQGEKEDIQFEWCDLPVDVEFVLDKLTISLSELEKISVGDTLSLA